MNENRQNIYKKRVGPATFKEREEALFADFPNYSDSLGYKVANLDKAKDIIMECLDGIIRVFGDYDVDGMTAVRELAMTIDPLMPVDIKYYIPKRESDGYGITPDLLKRELPELTDEHKNRDALVITVDNGIAAAEAVRYAKESGWKVLIIDHHLPAKEDDGITIIHPPADVIVDPHYTGESDFISYCAAGLVFKLAQFMYGDSDDDSTMKKIHSLAAIGTVADCVPLIEKVDGHNSYDNYIIVKKGLETLRQNDGTTVGLYCLLRAINREYAITETDIAYSLAPTMNAMSRMEDNGAQFVFDLLGRTSDYTLCDNMAQRCVDANKDRKNFTASAIPILKERIEADGHESDYPIIVVANEGEVHPGIIGLIAGNLSTAYNSMVIVLGYDADGKTLRGSGRAPEGCDLKSALDAVKEHLGKYGGHTAAAGVSLPADNLKRFTEAIQKYCGDKPEALFDRYYDYDISENQIASEIAIAKQYAPFGMGHTPPIYKIAFECEKRQPFTVMGAAKNMLRLNGRFANAVDFTGNILPKYEGLGHPVKINVCGTLNENIYNGKTSNQIMINDLEAL